MKMTSWQQIVFPVALVLLFEASGCDPISKDIRAYYFPVKQLTEGQVYEYRSLEPGSDRIATYWYYRSFILPDSAILTATYYEDRFEPLQFSREEIIHNGVLQNQLTLYEPDSSGRSVSVSVDIQSPNLFPFKVKENGGIFLYRASWQMPSEQGAKTTLIKNRRYVGDTTIQVFGKKYACVVFEVKEMVEHYLDGYIEYPYEGREYYAKGVGLVRFDKSFDSKNSISYGLFDRYPMDTLLKKFDKYISNKNSLQNN